MAAKKNKSSRSLLFWLPTLFLFIPGAYILWMLNQTSLSESNALRNEIRLSYRQNLISTSKGLASYWETLDADMRLNTSFDPIEILSLTGADSLILYDNSNQMIFPRLPDPPRIPENDEFENAFNAAQRQYMSANNQLAAMKFIALAKRPEALQKTARALLMAARCFIADKKYLEARRILKLIFDRKFKHASDLKHNNIILEAQISYLEISALDSALHKETLSELITEINTLDFIKSPQKINVCRRIMNIHPEVYFPLYEAEKKATAALLIDRNPVRRNVLLKTPLKDTWQYAVNSRLILLFTEDNLEQKMLELIQFADIPENTMIHLVPPYRENKDHIVAGDAAYRMPGWKISLNFIEPAYMESLIKERTRVFSITAVFVLGITLILSVLFVRDTKRRLQLADLKNDLVANVTHELKTPLASTRLLLDTMMSYPEIPAEKIKHYLEHLSSENTRLCRLVDQFLAFSKLEKHQYSFQFQDININELLSHLEEAIRGRFTPADAL